MADGTRVMKRPALLAPSRQNSPALTPHMLLVPHRRAAKAFWPGLLQRVWRYLRRESVGVWLGPVAIAAALTALHVLGASGLSDGRFFDWVTTNEAGRTPRVVLVEQASGQSVESRALEAKLAELGVVRIGYLGLAHSRAGERPTGYPSVIQALPARVIPAARTWRLEGRAPAGTEAAARMVLSPDYGIYRAQSGALAGRNGPISTFESALAGRTAHEGEFLLRMPRDQSIPAFSASQLIKGQLRRGELSGLVALVAPAGALIPRYTTPLTPDNQGMSEARLRAYAVQSLISGREVHRASSWETALLLLILALVLALAFARVDPKRFALALPAATTLLVLGGGWATLQFAHKLLPLSALIAVPWAVTFQRVLLREWSQDRHLENAASRAMQHSFQRSALREGARLPEFLGTAARIAGVKKSLLVEQLPGGRIEEIFAQDTRLEELTGAPGDIVRVFDRLRKTSLSMAAQHLVPGWGAAARVSWLGAARGDMFWIYAVPQTPFQRKSQRILRAMIASFRELFRWRSDLNTRSRHDERHVPIDDRVASAIALISRESEQVRHGIDALDTAVVLFHLIGSPLHANARMHEIFRSAGMALAETDLPQVLARLTDLDGQRIEAMLQQLLLNGGEMRIPMRELGSIERMLRLAVPVRLGRREARVIALEAIDMASLNRAADLRQAVALYIDAQLRNDLEAILIGADLAQSPKITTEQIRPVLARIAETARRGTGRLNEVTGLIRAKNAQVVDACYPIDARKLALEAADKVADFARDLAVRIDADLPGIGGFTLAEPRALGEMLVAMLRVVLSDTPRGESVLLRLEEMEGRSRIRITGGFGMGFERLVGLLSGDPDESVGDFKLIADGMAKALQWDALVSYWGREADGFGFNVDLRRIG